MVNFEEDATLWRKKKDSPVVQRGASFVKVKMYIYIMDVKCECSVQMQQELICVFLIEIDRMYRVILLNGV
jgi:hypothetical protein